MGRGIRPQADALFEIVGFFFPGLRGLVGWIGLLIDRNLGRGEAASIHPRWHASGGTLDVFRQTVCDDEGWKYLFVSLLPFGEGWSLFLALTEAG